MFLVLLFACGGSSIDLMASLTCDGPSPDLVAEDVRWPEGPAPCKSGRPVAVMGHVELTGEIADLSGLSCVCAIAGDLRVEGVTGLGSIEGLTSLQEVRGDLLVLDNPSLRHVGELGKLHTVGGNLVVERNENMESVDGLNAVKTVGGDVHIRFNPNMTLVDGLDNVENVGGAIQLQVGREQKSTFQRAKDFVVGGYGVKGKALPPWMRLVLMILSLMASALFLLAIGFKLVERTSRMSDSRLNQGPPVGADVFEHLRFDDLDRNEKRELPPALDYVEEYRLAQARPYLRFVNVDLGDPVFQAGATDTVAVWVVEGELEVRVNGRDVGAIVPNMVAGEMSMFEMASQSADVLGAMETRLVVLQRKAYESLCELGNPVAKIFEQSIIAGQGAQIRAIRKRLVAQLRKVRIANPELDREKVITKLRAFMDDLPARVANQRYDLATVLSMVPAFDHFGAEEHALLSARFDVTEISAGEPVYVQTMRSTDIYVVVQGEAGLFMCVQQAEELVQVGQVHPLDVIGLGSFLPSRPHEVSCVALTDLTLLSLSRRTAEWLIGLDEPIGRNFRIGLIRAMSAAIRDANAHILGSGFGRPQAECTGRARPVIQRVLPPLEDEVPEA